jgi:hypothetical protein
MAQRGIILDILLAAGWDLKLTALQLQLLQTPMPARLEWHEPNMHGVSVCFLWQKFMAADALFSLLLQVHLRCWLEATVPSNHMHLGCTSNNAHRTATAAR